MKKLVLDVDGILTDIWTPVANYIHSYAELYKNKGIIALPESTWAYSNLARLAPCEVDELTIFDMGDCWAWDFSPFPTYLKSAIIGAFGELTELYSAPIPMFDTIIRPSGGNDYLHTEYICCSDTAASFEMWHSLVGFLLGYFDIEFHTHVALPSNADLRLKWLQDTFSYGDTAGKVSYKVITGSQKGIMSGDIVVDDGLYNILDADAPCRILHCLFHNAVNRGGNFARWKQAGLPKVKVYGSFEELCSLLLRLISELFDIEPFLVRKAYLNYITKGRVENDKK